MTLKKFLKYIDDMEKLYIYDWSRGEEEPLPENRSANAEKCLLFEGHVFDKGAKKKLKKLYEAGYVLERNEDGSAMLLYPYVNEHGVALCKVQINVCLPKEN